MGTLKVVILDQDNQTIGEEMSTIPGTSIDDCLRSARALLSSRKHKIRSVSASSETAVVAYVYAVGREPKDLGAPRGWVWQTPASSKKP